MSGLLQWRETIIEAGGLVEKPGIFPGSYLWGGDFNFLKALLFQEKRRGGG